MNTSRILTLSGLAGLGLALTLAAGTMMAAGQPEKAPAPAASAQGAAKTFTIDPVHSNVIFKVKHLNASNFYGRFNETNGSFTLGETANINVTVKADSVDSNNTKRNDHIKSPDFLSAKEFADISFTAKDLKKINDTTWQGHGDLKFHGVTKSIEINLTKTGGGPGMGGKGEVAGVETTVTIKRSDFGVKTMIGPVSDDVTLIVALEGGSK